jgi:4-hydroxyproline epimerase
MCGHGTIGLMVTLAHLGKVNAGDHRIETPVGTVTARLNADGSVAVRNVPSYRLAKGVEVDVPGHGRLRGDVAWGGNWFFLVEDHGQALDLDHVDSLLEFTWRIRQALARAGITGRAGQEIDHIELFGPPSRTDCQSRNFVLCPGRAYDRSPCGTGTSAKLACLFEDGKLRAGERWRQESIIGSVFEGTMERVGEDLIPTIQGTAHVTAESTLLLDTRDPLCWGIRPEGRK